MPFAEINGASLFYESHGSGPAIVFAHGRGGNHLSWWRQVASFQQDFRCVIFDQRGWGLSKGPAGAPDPATVSGDLLALLDYLEIDRTVLVAQSMGGISSLRVALQKPERVSGLVLADTTGGIGDASVVSLLAEVHPPDEPLRRALSDGFIAGHPDLTFLFGSIGRINQPMPVSVVSEMFRNPEGPQASDLVAMTVPTLLVVGEEDAIFPVHVIEAVRRLIPGSRLEVVPGAAHSTHFEQADAFNQLLREFIAGCQRTSRDA
ncbi:MAG: alpha/beta hydrolase [Chloroflexota bacterium]|nr:alpha/beta hydrolase [Chloroflexota bacterium]MDE2685644.1 alpha/beta hydrolase [Chloroflexota bacterium]